MGFISPFLHQITLHKKRKSPILSEISLYKLFFKIQSYCQLFQSHYLLHQKEAMNSCELFFNYLHFLFEQS